MVLFIESTNVYNSIYLPVSCLGADIESALKEKIIAKIDSMKSV